MPGLFVQRHAKASQLFNDVKVLYLKGYPDQEEKEMVSVSEPLDELRIYLKSRRGIFFKIPYYFNFIKAHFQGFDVLSKAWGRRPDLVHVNILTREGVIALLWKKLYGIPYVITEHWTRYHTGAYKGFFRKLVTKLVVKNAAAVMPVTDHLRRSMEACGLKGNYSIVPNVVDVKAFKPGHLKKSVKKQILHISCFLDEHKNISGIIDAASDVYEHRKDFKIVFVGDGVDFEMLKAYAFSKKEGLALFEFRGMLEGKAVVKEIQNSDFHLMFSRYENLPVVNLECFACGIPVLSSDVGGIREHLPKQLGRLVPSEDKDALQKAMNEMLDELPDYDPTYIRNYAMRHFSQEAIGKSFDAIYNKAIASQQGNQK